VRTILHADLDAFYASVEQLDHPEWRGKPLVVGGPPESRGVVAAASYEVRAFGVRSAMPMSRAVRLCPDLIRVSPRFPRYIELSRQVMAIFRSLTPLVEPLSMDEAFLDITGWIEDGADATAIARELKREVMEKVHLVVSIGGGTSKTIAKVASDLGKPDGLLIVAPGDEEAFLAPLPVGRLFGIGPKSERVLQASGIRTVADLAKRNLRDLERILGSRAEFVQAMAVGKDDRPVEPEQERKSVGAETTFAHDLEDGPELRTQLRRIADEVARRLQHGHTRARTVALKLRYENFTTITRQTSVTTPTDSAAEIARLAGGLLDTVVTPNDRFRLLGIQCSKLTDQPAAQATLFDQGWAAER
jgi:DNA polymerase-4